MGERQRARLRALAGHYLGSPQTGESTAVEFPATPSRPRWLLSARAEGVPTPWAEAIPREAARRLGLPLLALRREGRLLGRGPAGVEDRPAAVVHLDLGPLAERDLERLPHGGPGPDLLLWYADREGVSCPRQLYLLACLASRLLPTQLLYLAPAGESGAADRTVDSLRGLVQIKTMRMDAYCLPPGNEPEEGICKLMIHLQGLLHRGRGMVGLLLFFLILALPAGAQEGGSSGFSLVVEGLKNEQPLVGGGQQVWSSRNHVLSVRAGMGTFSPDSSSFYLILPREKIRLFEDGLIRSLDAGRGAIEKPMVILGPGVSFRVAAGEYELGPDRMRVRIETGMSPLEQRRSYMVALGIAFLIFALMWNTTRMRKKLDEPHISLRPKRKA